MNDTEIVVGTVATRAAQLRKTIENAPEFVDNTPVEAMIDEVVKTKKDKFSPRMPDWVPNWLGLPQDCPVHPLGKLGQIFYYLDTQKQLTELKSGEHGRLPLAGLFGGRVDYLTWVFPKENKEGKITGPSFDDLGYALMRACEKRGLWDPQDRVRGRGCWMNEDAMLTLHLGDRVIQNNVQLDPGEIDRHIYPAGDKLPGPAESDKTNTAGFELYSLFRTWYWERGDIDAALLLGWMVSGILSGALSWRPMVFLVGDRATGKSTLQEVLKFSLGQWLLQTNDTTPAGITQALKYDARPVAVDEIEADTDNRRGEALMKLARIAASGGTQRRGSSDHSAREFNARSCFLFSAINAPPMLPQDLSRFAMLRLKEIPASAARPKIDFKQLQKLGIALLTRVVENAPNLPILLEKYRDVMAKGGHGGRGQDTFGTLLACAELAIGDFANDTDLPFGKNADRWADLLAPATLSELEDAAPNWRRCLDHMLSTPVEAWRNGTRPSVGQFLSEFIDSQKSTLGEQITLTEARKELSKAGLSIQPPENSFDEHWLVVPNQNALLQRLFIGTEFFGRVGMGGWRDAIRQAPRDTAEFHGLWTTGLARVCGIPSKSTLIRISVLLNDGVKMGALMRAPQIEYDDIDF